MLSACAHQSPPIPEPDPSLVYRAPASGPLATLAYRIASDPERPDTVAVVSSLDGWVVRAPAPPGEISLSISAAAHPVSALCVGNWGAARALLRLDVVPGQTYALKCHYDHVILGPTHVDLWIEDAAGAKVASAVGEVFGGGGTNTIFIPIVLPRK